MNKKLLNKLWLRVGMIVAIMTTALSGTAWAETETLVSGSGTSNYAVPSGWTISGTVEGGSYLKFDDGTITSPEFAPHTGLSFTYTVATFGSGTNHPLTIRVLNASTNAVIVEKTTATPTSSSYINTDSPLSLGDVNVAFKIQLYGPTGKGVRLRNYSITGTPAGGTPTPTTYTVTYNANGGTGTMTDLNSPYEENDEVTLLTNTFTAPEGKIWDTWEVKDASNNDITISNGKFTMPASNVTVKAQWVDDPNAPQYEWVLTDWSNLQEGDVFVIVGNGTKAMDNSVVGSNPSALAVTTENGKITSTVTNAMMWNRSAVDGGYKLLPNGSTTNWLNNPNSTSLRVDNKTSNSIFTYETYSNKNYLKVGTRYVCIASSGDWRAYAEQNVSSNATNTTFYRRQVVSTDPTIEASNVSINYDATGGNIDFTINNEVSGGELTAAVLSGGTIDNLTIGTITSSTVPFTCDANTETTEKTATIRLTYTFNTNESVTKDVTITQAAAPVTSDWVLTDLSALTASDIFVIVGNNGDTFAMSNNNGTSGAPTAVAVTVSGNYITSQVPETIRWTISGNATDGYTFYPNGDTGKWLYCTNTNNGVRVGTGDAKHFTVDQGYLTTAETTDQRYIGIYNSQDWRCYTSINSNIEGQTFTFYKYVGAPLPVITAEDVEIAYNVTSGSISYEVENPVEGGTLTASTEDAWLTLGTVTSSSVPFTASANDALAGRTASVTLTYTFGTETTTKTISITQTGNPDVKGGANNPYTVTEALAVISSLEDGGKTESEVYTKGTITAIEEVELEQYYNATYTISDETNDLMVYHGKYIDNANFTSADQIHEGDVVVIYGKLQKYVKQGTTTPEIAQGNYIVSQAQAVTVSAAGYATFVAEADLKIPADVEVYAVTINGAATSAHLEAIEGGIPQGEAVLVKASAGTYEFEYTDESVEAIANNDLQAATAAFNPSAANTIYCLAKKNGTVGFYPVATTVTIPVGKAYLEVTSGEAPVKGFYGFEFDDDPTGIENLNANVNLNEGAIFNLAGQRLQKMQKGINIVNGKKILK